MSTTALHELIQQTHFSEAHHGHLTDLIASRLPRLHRIIQPQGENTEDILTRFIHAYAEQAPDLLDAANSMTRGTGIEERIGPVLRTIEQFFFTPPALFTGHGDLNALLDEAYLTHHLMEEVNDRYIAHSDQALIPLDTTVANLVAHQLIGKPFVNRLNEAVHHAMGSMLNATTFDVDSARAYREDLKSPRMVAAWQQRPYLSKQFEAGLSLG